MLLVQAVSRVPIQRICRNEAGVQIAEAKTVSVFSTDGKKYPLAYDRLLLTSGSKLTEGWDRQIKLTHAKGKARKRMINTQWIYPPAPNRAEALAAGNPLASFG